MTTRYPALPNFPEKIIIMVTSHGEIPTTEGVPLAYTVPEGMRIAKLNAAPLGECNIMNQTTSDLYAKALRRNIGELTRAQTKDQYLDILKHMIRFMKKQDIIEIMPQVAVSVMDPEGDTQRKGYYNRVIQDMGYHANFFGPGDQVINKIFSRNNAEVEGADWKLNIINMDKMPDLMAWLKRQTRAGKSVTTLEEVINYLKSHGVKDIVFMDFSCSVFLNYDEDYHLGEREKRATRRSLVTDSLISKKRRTGLESPFFGYGGIKRRRRTNRSLTSKKQKKHRRRSNKRRRTKN